MNGDLYFVRMYNLIGDSRFAPPRRRDTVRRNLSGTRCVLAFAPDQVPAGWNDGRTAEEMRDYLGLPEHEGIWYTNEEL